MPNSLQRTTCQRRRLETGSSPEVAQNLMKHNLPLFLLTFLIGLGMLHLPAAAMAAEEESPVREIFVPFDDLNVLLEGDSQRVFLTARNTRI